MTDIERLEARVKRLEKALEPFAALGRQLLPVKDELGVRAAGDAARSSSCWTEYENAAKVLYGDEVDHCGTEGHDDKDAGILDGCTRGGYKMIKEVYINAEFTKEQLDRAAQISVAARRQFFQTSHGNLRKAMAEAEMAGLEAALDALTDMWSEKGS